MSAGTRSAASSAGGDGVQHLGRQRARHGVAEALVDGRQLVGDALVAVDAGLTLGEALLVGPGGAAGLLGIVEVAEVVAVAALLGVVALHAPPLVLGQLGALGLELLRGVDGAQHLVQDRKSTRLNSSHV